MDSGAYLMDCFNHNFLIISAFRKIFTKVKCSLHQGVVQNFINIEINRFFTFFLSTLIRISMQNTRYQFWM